MTRSVAAQVDVLVLLSDSKRRILQNLHHARQELQHHIALAAREATVEDLQFLAGHAVRSMKHALAGHIFPRLALSVTFVVYHWLYLPPIFWKRAFIHGCFFSLQAKGPKPTHDSAEVFQVSLSLLPLLRFAAEVR